jgi:monovalent cation/hydrogen antiporter
MATTLTVVLGVLTAILLIAVLARRVRVPLPIALVVGGTAVALLPGMPPIELDPELILAFSATS